MIDPNIEAVILDEETMRKLGFTDRISTQWYFVRPVANSISFNLTIPKDNPAGFKIEVLDEDFLQHYNFASMNHDYAVKVGEKVNLMLLYLQKFGVITGYVDGNPKTGVH